MRNPGVRLLTVTHHIKKEEVDIYGKDGGGLDNIVDGLMAYETADAIVHSEFMVMERKENDDGSMDVTSQVVVMTVHEYKDFLKWWGILEFQKTGSLYGFR